MLIINVLYSLCGSVPALALPVLYRTCFQRWAAAKDFRPAAVLIPLFRVLPCAQYEKESPTEAGLLKTLVTLSHV